MWCWNATRVLFSGGGEGRVVVSVRVAAFGKDIVLHSL